MMSTTIPRIMTTNIPNDALLRMTIQSKRHLKLLRMSFIDNKLLLLVHHLQCLNRHQERLHRRETRLLRRPRALAELNATRTCKDPWCQDRFSRSETDADGDAKAMAERVGSGSYYSRVVRVEAKQVRVDE